MTTVTTNLTTTAAAFAAKCTAAGISRAEGLRRAVAAWVAPVVTPPAPAPPPVPAPTYAFADDFTTGTLDPTKWTRETGQGYGVETYTTDADLAAIEGGQLRLSAKKNADGSWRAAQVSTYKHFATNGGTFEARIKLPSALGFWAGIWFSNDPWGRTPSGQVAELDWIEQFNGGDWGGAAWLPLSVHDWKHPLTPGVSRKAQIPFKSALTDNAFHTVTLKWTATSVEPLVDGVSQGVLTKAQFEAQTGGTWMLNDQPMSLYMQVAVMGNGRPGAGYPAPAASTTQGDMLIDYVRVTAA